MVLCMYDSWVDKGGYLMTCDLFVLIQDFYLTPQAASCNQI